MKKQQWKPGKYALSSACRNGKLRTGRRKTQYHHTCMGGNCLLGSVMVSVSIRPERYSYHIIRETGEFVINLTTKKLAYAADYCGVKSGRDVDKWKETGLTPEKSDIVKAPCIAQSPVNIECRVVRKEQLGSHDLFLAVVAAVHADEQYMDEKGGFHLEKQIRSSTATADIMT